MGRRAGSRRDTAFVGADVSWPIDLLAQEVAPLAHALSDPGVPPPAQDCVGFEVDDQGWQAELGWDPPKIAVLADGPETGMRRGVRSGRGV